MTRAGPGSALHQHENLTPHSQPDLRRLGGSTPVRQSRATLQDGKRDVVMLVDHDLSHILARTKNDSLRFTDSTDSLRFAVALPDTGEGRDIYELARRGTLGGMSMGFRLASSEFETNDDGQRLLRSVDLCEILVVSAFPAYETSIEAWSRNSRERRVETNC